MAGAVGEVLEGGDAGDDDGDRFRAGWGGVNADVFDDGRRAVN